MYPFEVWNHERQEMDFYWDRWSLFSDDLFRQYPVNHHQRVELSLIFPADRLEDVWVHDWNPHHEIGNYHLSVYDCFYDNADDWSTIFEVYPAHITTGRGREDSWRFFIEKDHENPWGEPIRIMSTASDINDSTAHRYAYFRGRYWKIHGWMPHTRRWAIPAFAFDFDFNIGLLPDAIVRLIMGSQWARDNTAVNWTREGF